MIRKIVKIDEEKCTGCGLCAQACHEGAIQMINGKAKLISDEYCDGLGDCLPACPADAIAIIEREAADYDEEKVKVRLAAKRTPAACQCPGSAERTLKSRKHDTVHQGPDIKEESPDAELNNWPVQLHLINPNASYLDDADLLIAADCAAYAHGDFHREFIKGRVAMIGCPKLDDISAYREKITAILNQHTVKSITVVRMEVPCCGGIVGAVRKAMLDSGTIVPYREVIVGLDGTVRE